MDIFSDRIRPLFDSTGLSDKEIAAELGIPVKLIYNWNNGVKSYNKYFDKIANYFHVSVEFLKGETDDKSPPPVGYGLNDREKLVLSLFNRLPAANQEGVIAQLQGLVQFQEAQDARSKSE